MRTFIAINFNDDTVEQIVSVQEQLAARGVGNFTRRENLHLTLAFLGEIGVDEVADVRAAMDSQSVPEMDLTFATIGCFRGDSELWWIGLAEEPQLIKLQKSLINALRREGLHPDAKKFKPHITLARQMHIGKANIKFEPFTTRVNSISLMLSERVNGKLTYTEIYRVENNG